MKAGPWFLRGDFGLSCGRADCNRHSFAIRSGGDFASQQGASMKFPVVGLFSLNSRPGALTSPAKLPKRGQQKWDFQA
ncbi:hypothetical protein [Paramesorhizobium deserti]|uniref:hypothetical protein n=1 Tax=Paramesorhizobium deserti TaxID=1494590 RepID=UPI00128FDCE7|nr:hypothetical protein [Paramesorhizobium deserti]